MQNNNFKKISYRPDIDGLRAIAVLSVLIFHVFPTRLPGGFVGVDIFFIISGYLITSIILKDLEQNSFSLIQFYRKRVMRIFPSLVLVLCACLACAWFALLPTELAELGKHTAGGAGFIINFILWKEAGYFDTLSELKPLLHLWSLAIEEQFYIIWPLLLLVFSRRAKKLIPVLIVGMLIVSFAISLSVLHKSPEEAFYSPASRFWELLLGAILASHHHKKSQSLFSSSSLIRNYQSLLGILLIGYAIFNFSNKTHFPGWHALIPTVGALLIINSPSSPVNSMVLSFRPLVAIGLISYPLYLWHWPLLVLARITNEGEPGTKIKAAIIFLIFFLSISTYFFIEKPLRLGRQTRSLKRAPAILSLLLISVGLFGTLLYLKAGFPNRIFLNSNIQQMTSYTLEITGTENCIDSFTKFPSSFCQKTILPPTLAIIGDSHSGVIFAGFAESTEEPQSKRVIVMGSGSCQPILGFEEEREGCSTQLKSALNIIKASPSINTVVMTSYYKPLSSGDKEITKKYLRGYKNTFTELMRSKKNIFLIMDTPTLNFSPETCINRRPLYLSTHKKRDICAFSAETYLAQRVHYNAFMKKLAKENPNVHFYDPSNTFFKDKMYWAVLDGKVVYGDFNHLNNIGAKKVVEDFFKSLKPKYK